MNSWMVRTLKRLLLAEQQERITPLAASSSVSLRAGVVRSLIHHSIHSFLLYMYFIHNDYQHQNK